MIEKLLKLIYKNGLRHSLFANVMNSRKGGSVPMVHISKHTKLILSLLISTSIEGYRYHPWNPYGPRSDLEWYPGHRPWPVGFYPHLGIRKQPFVDKPLLADQLSSEDTDERSPHSEDSTSYDEEYDSDDGYSRQIHWDSQTMRPSDFNSSLAKAAQLSSEDTEEKSSHSEDSSTSDEMNSMELNEYLLELKAEIDSLLLTTTDNSNTSIKQLESTTTDGDIRENQTIPEDTEEKSSHSEDSSRSDEENSMEELNENLLELLAEIQNEDQNYFDSSLTDKGIYPKSLEKDDHELLGSSLSDEDISSTTTEQGHHKSFGSSLTDEGIYPKSLEKDDHEPLGSSLSDEDISSTTTEQDSHGSFGSSNKDFQSTTEEQDYSQVADGDTWYDKVDKIISSFHTNILIIVIVVGICSVIMIVLSSNIDIMSVGKRLNKKERGSRLKLIV